MNKFVKVLLIISASLLGLGLLIAATGFAWSYRFAQRYESLEFASMESASTTNQTFEVDAASLERITISLGLSDVRFEKVSDPAKARVETKGFFENELKFSQENGRLTLENRSLKNGFSLFNCGLFRVDWQGRVHLGAEVLDRSVTIYLPECVLAELTFEGGVGDISGDLPISADVMRFNCGAGDLSLSNLNAKSLRVSGGVGDVTLENFAVESLEFSGGTGDVRLADGSASERSIISGGVFSLDMKDVELHNLSLSGGTGDIDFTGVMRGSCSVEAGVGDVTLRFSDSADNYSMHLDRGIGSVNAHNADMVVEEHGYAINPHLDAENTVEISMGVGSVELSFSK